MANEIDYANCPIRNVEVVEGGFNCEIEHPTYGWIPFYATANDPQPGARAVHQRAQELAET